jgi:hypothetical protein
MRKVFITIGLLFLGTWLYSQELQVLHLEGTYDLDGDDLQEFATIESGTRQGQPLQVIRYYELDAAGFQQLLWELEAPPGKLGNFVGVLLGDLEGDGTPELITVMNLSDEGAASISQPVLFYYQWEGDGFSEDPTGSLNVAPGNAFLRCYNFDLLDMDGDGDQEPILALGSPWRGFVVVDVSDSGELKIVARLRPDGLRSGSGFVYVSAVDWDRDGLDEVVGYSPEGNVLRIQPFFNEEGTFVPGEPVKSTVRGINGLLPMATKALDWDLDGFVDILLPFQSGHLVALTLSPATVAVETIPVDGGPLSDLSVADFNQDGLEDLLLVSGEMNMLSLVYGTVEEELAPEYFTLEGEQPSVQVFATLPVLTRGVYTGSLVAAGWDGTTSTLFISDIGKPSPERLAPPEEPEMEHPLLEEEEDDLLASFPEISPEELTLEFPKIPQPIRTTGQPLPKDVLPRHVLPVNQLFVYAIPENEARQFFSFRWLQPPPKGMFFHYESRSIQWVPDETQLGAFRLSYHVEMKVGETINLQSQDEDSLLTYQVVPQLEGYDEMVWIYVNDPPVILSEPQGTEFVANTLFTYKPVVQDRNVDARLYYDLEVKPEGMELLEDGTIVWQTDSTDVDVYDVRLVVTDGFDRAVQEFKLFARAGVKILSEADSLATVGQPYHYQVEVWRPDLKQKLGFQLLQAPEGMTLSPEGAIDWMPTVAQVDTQRFTIVANHGVATDTQTVTVFVNHPPIVEAAPPPVVKVEVGDIWEFQLGVSDPNQRDRLTFTAQELPEGMRMDPYSGRLRWEPARENIDFSNLVIEVTDGRETRTIESRFFVNAPVKIVSMPPLQATVGEPYQYRIMVTDLNTAALLPYEHPVLVEDVSKIRIYSVNISDDVYRENIQRYIGDWERADVVYLKDQSTGDVPEVSRLNLKKYVHSLFWENDRLVIVLETIDDRTVSIKDVLWEFFQGSQGKPPKVIVERISPIRYTLEEFPDGMEVDELTGTINWTPGKDQVDTQVVSLLVSDGYTKDEQTFEIYVNHPPTIVSTAPELAVVGEVYRYQVRVEDKNSDAKLTYTLLKGPQGMQMSRSGKVVWIPKPAQINGHRFAVKVSDGLAEDIQTSRVFVNIPPSIISTPKPVALTGYEYRYRVVAEDLNGDKITFRPVRLPKYAAFNKKTGLLRWKPRNNQVGPHDVIIAAIDSRGAATTHEFQIHTFANPDARRFVNTGWPLLLTFVGVMFAWGMAQM